MYKLWYLCAVCGGLDKALIFGKVTKISSKNKQQELFSNNLLGC
jgi:hypothetical protein